MTLFGARDLQIDFPTENLSPRESLSFCFFTFNVFEVLYDFSFRFHIATKDLISFLDYSTSLVESGCKYPLTIEIHISIRLLLPFHRLIIHLPSQDQVYINFSI
jgi:hypothetical protein